jgi:hypothetical protein
MMYGFDLGHHGYLGYFVYLGGLRHCYHSSVFSFVTTVAVITLNATVAFLRLLPRLHGRMRLTGHSRLVGG